MAAPPWQSVTGWEDRQNRPVPCPRP